MVCPVMVDLTRPVTKLTLWILSVSHQTPGGREFGRLASRLIVVG